MLVKLSIYDSMDEKNYTIEDFRGGQSSERKKGPRGSFKYAENVNIHSNDNVLTCNQALVKDSGTVVVDLVLAMFRASDDTMWAFGDTGKIYKKSAGTWALFHTDTDGKISGAREYEVREGENWVSYIYYATKTKLKKFPLTGAAGDITQVDTFEKGTEPHTMRIAEGFLVICDGDVLGLVDFEGAFNKEALFIPPGEISNCLLDLDTKVIIGTENAIKDGSIFLWSLLFAEEESWDTKRETQGGETNAMGFLENGIMIQSGKNGALRFWTQSGSIPLKKIKDTTFAYPDALATYNGILHIAMNGTNSGIYSLGRLDNNDPLAVNLEYKLSGTLGSLARDDTNLYVSWKVGSTYGISKIDFSNKVKAVYESLEFDDRSPQMDKHFSTIKIVSRPVPKDCLIEVEYKTNRDTDWQKTHRSDGEEDMSEGESIGIFDIEGTGESYEVRVTLTPNSNNSPEVISINTYFTSGQQY